MSLNQASNAFDLLGQTEKPTAPVRLKTGEGPALEVSWGSFHQGIGSSLGVLLHKTSIPKYSRLGEFFKDSWVERRIPRRALVAAALWHFVFLILPFPQLPAAARHFSAFDNTELTWSGPVTDLPLLAAKSPKAKPSPRGEPEKRPFTSASVPPPRALERAAILELRVMGRDRTTVAYSEFTVIRTRTSTSRPSASNV